jgi:hypothetical protein
MNTAEIVKHAIELGYYNKGDFMCHSLLQVNDVDVRIARGHVKSFVAKIGKRVRWGGATALVAVVNRLLAIEAFGEMVNPDDPFVPLQKCFDSRGLNLCALTVGFEVCFNIYTDWDNRESILTAAIAEYAALK